jgi:hypothetical protein
MIALDLQEVADAVVRRAERQGYVVPSDIRDEVAQAGLPESSWKEVLDLARPALNYRHGRYHHLHTVSERVQEVRGQQQVIQGAIRQIVICHRKNARSHDRREQERVDFMQPIRLLTDDLRAFNVLSRDLSATGLRFISTRSFLGQKVRVTLPRSCGIGPWNFAVRVLWTCSIADDMFENGGTFLELLPGDDVKVTFSPGFDR